MTEMDQTGWKMFLYWAWVSKA